MAVNIVLLNVATSGLREISEEDEVEGAVQQQQLQKHHQNNERASVDEVLKQLAVRNIVIDKVSRGLNWKKEERRSGCMIRLLKEH